MSKFRAVFLLLLTAGMLAGCIGVSQVVERPVTIDSGVGPQPSATMEERVVTLVSFTATPPQSATPTPMLAATPTAITLGPDDTLDAMGVEVFTYQDESAGFALDVPADWQRSLPSPEVIESSTAYSATFLSHLVERGPKQQEGLAEGQAKLDVTVIKYEGDSQESAAELRQAQLESAEMRIVLLGAYSVILPSGMEAVIFQLETMEGPMYEMVTAVNGHQLLVTGVGDLTYFNAIIASLRPLE